jgi:uncharacterized coiled-coil protein SlyX
MLSSNRPVVYSLLTIVVLLLLGIVAMLNVADQRNQRLKDQTTDLKRHLFRQQRQIRTLKEKLEDCDTAHTDRAIRSPAWGRLPTGESI